MFRWFHENGLIANSSISHFLMSPFEATSIQIQNSCNKVTFFEELITIKTGSNITFHDHITSLCSKANKKLSTSKHMDINKRWILTKSYIFSQFNYCHLVWICHSSSLKKKLTEYRKERCYLCIENMSHVSKNFFRKINLSLSARKTYSILP